MEEETPMGLTAKTCVPCQGETPPLTTAMAETYLAEAPGWSLDGEATRIERRFDFPNFLVALDFVNKLGALAEKEGHHPDISFGWGYCTVVFYTHKINGLHENDFIMAAKVNTLA
ncbi:MAG: 4a-hydroxytetrahydrobiopterin dehydratase [Gammaproteobacteria bacterium]|nr:4a-hydroxytetrahydrobiopterin dehydratase [Gammaproteobacteria bacterium]